MRFDPVPGARKSSKRREISFFSSWFSRDWSNIVPFNMGIILLFVIRDDFRMERKFRNNKSIPSFFDYYIFLYILYIYIKIKSFVSKIKIYLISLLFNFFSFPTLTIETQRTMCRTVFQRQMCFLFFFFFLSKSFSPRSRKHWNNLAPLENNTCATRWAYFMRLHALWLNIVPISVFNLIVSNYREFVTDWR